MGNGFVIPAAHGKMMSAFRRLRAHTLEYEKILQLSIKDMSANRRLILKIGFALKSISTLLTVLPLCKMGLAFQHRRNDDNKNFCVRPKNEWFLVLILADCGHAPLRGQQS